MTKNYRRAKAPPAAHRPIPPIPQATTASPARQPPFQLAQAAIGIPALLFALGVGMIPQSFWGAVILICSFQATFLLRGANPAPRDRNDDGGVGWLTRLCRRAALTIRLCLMPRRRFFPRSPR